MLGKLLVSFLQWIGNFFFDLIPTWLDKLINLFPHSPFTWLSASPFADLIGKINYFIPVYDFLTILEAWLVAIGIYYMYSIWARWLKGIE